MCVNHWGWGVVTEQPLPPPSLCEYMSGGGLASGWQILRLSDPEQQSRAEWQAGALVFVHPLVPHGLPPLAEGAGAQDAAGHDDVLQQVLGQEGAVAGLGHVRPPAAAAAPHGGADGENSSFPSSSSLCMFKFSRVQSRTRTRTRKILTGFYWD